MKKEIATKWAETLETTDVKQGQRMLRSEAGEMCCLGLLCDLSGLGRWELERATPGVEGHYAYVVGSGEDIDFNGFLLPAAVSEWAGLGDVNDSDVALGDSSASHLNDADGLTFKEIAAEVRKHLL